MIVDIYFILLHIQQGIIDIDIMMASLFSFEINAFVENSMGFHLKKIH